MHKFLLPALVATAGLSLATVYSAPAQAAAFSLGSCKVTDVTAEGQNATACQNFSGNNNNYSVGNGPSGFENYISSAFSSKLTGYTPGGTWSGAYSDVNGDNLNNITGSNIQSGVWSLLQNVNSPFVITVKASNFFAAYLFTGLQNVNDGTFNVAGTTTKSGGGDPAALSHVSIYTYSGSPVNPPTAAAVPEPTTMAGLALAGAGLAVRRRKAQAKAN